MKMRLGGPGSASVEPALLLFACLQKSGAASFRPWPDFVQLFFAPRSFGLLGATRRRTTMKVRLIALAAGTVLAAAMPAYATTGQEVPGTVMQHYLMSLQSPAQRAAHCREVLQHPDHWSTQEVRTCHALH